MRYLSTGWTKKHNIGFEPPQAAYFPAEPHEPEGVCGGSEKEKNYDSDLPVSE